MKKGNRQDRNKLRRTLIRFAVPVWLLLYAFTTRLHAQTNTAQFAGVTYTNYHTKEPWSVHVVRIERSLPGLALLSPHANGAALGLTTLSQQLAQLHSSFGVPLAAINGDFYRRDSAFAGDPRGLQIFEGDLLSAPAGTAAFWVDAVGQPHVDDISSQFSIRLPQGKTIPFGLNEPCQGAQAVVYTSRFTSPLNGKGRELILASDGSTPLTPFRIGRKYSVRVVASRIPCSSSIPEGQLSLVLPLQLAGALTDLEPGARLEISTSSSPALHGVKTALSGGPILIKDSKRQKLSGADSDSFQVSSMFERHPRTAIGWNEHTFFFVEVDGRQKKLSVGMTLDELTQYLLSLGCENAINFDGGGSSTLWYLGKVRNSPCDRKEREIANSLVAVAPTHSASPIESKTMR